MEAACDIGPGHDDDIMQSPATRRRARRLLKLLKNQQHFDTVLTPALVMSFKYLLTYNNLCTRVRVKFTRDPVTGRKEDAFLRSETHRLDQAQFIVSQLEAWKIADPEKEQVTIPHALRIFLDCVVYDFKEEKGYPTVITWPCPIRHRTLYFFAYLNFDMPSGQYTIPELLELRKKGEVTRELVLKAMQPENELAALFEQNGISDWRGYLEETMPEVSPTMLVNLSNGNPIHKTSAAQPRDDSSSSSEEVLFKGTARRRQATSRETLASRQIKSNGDVVWKYSSRNDSAPAATEPLSAPTGLPAQKSEGFQRFYKAVVSPTHVRVTAGGRIVPNTRGTPPSPTLKRAPAGPVGGSIAGQEKPPGGNALAALSMAAGLGQHMPALMPGFFPAYGHPGFSAYGPQMPYYPMSYGHPMTGGYPPFPYPMPMMRQPSMDTTLKDTLNLKTGDGQVDDSDDAQKNTKIQTAPPSQFDQRRPFFFNGQWMYPVNGPFQPHPGAIGGPYMPMSMHMHMPMPMPMTAPPAAPTGRRAGTSSQPLQLGSPIKFTGPVATQAQARGSSIPGAMVPAVPGVPAFGAIQAPAAPPISSIRPSEITRKQIGIFRKSLKYHEDQLQYNRHQIDEKDTEHKIQKYREDIARFECMMQAQIEDEKQRGYPPLTDKERSPEGSSGSEQKLSSESDKAAANGYPTEQKASVSVPSAAENNQKALNTKGAHPASGSSSSQLTDDTPKSSGLPTGAALAPPFQPRKEGTSAQTVVDHTGPMWNVPTYQKQGVYSPYGQYGSQPWDASTLSVASPMYTSSDGQEFDPNVTSVTSKGYLGVPYLVGSLPRGMNPRTAKDLDYQYSRELTEDELRARHIYWGKVPRSAVRGLPKYDGRNFYPPTPTKDARATLSGAGDLMAFTPEPVTAKADIQQRRPSTPTGSALVPSDSFEHTQQNGEDGIYTSSDLTTAAEKLASAKGKHEAGVEDSASVASHDRRSEKPGGARLWEAMLKKGSAAALSSTTAEGRLQPQYAGSAAASLSPTVHRTPDALASASPSKDSSDLSDGGALLSPAQERRGKNLDLGGNASREPLANDDGPNLSTALAA